MEHYYDFLLCLGAQTITPILELAVLVIALFFAFSGEPNIGALELAGLAMFIFCFAGEIDLLSSGLCPYSVAVFGRRALHTTAVICTGISMALSISIIAWTANCAASNLLNDPTAIAICLPACLLLLPRIVLGCMNFATALHRGLPFLKLRSQGVTDHIGPMLRKLNK